MSGFESAIAALAERVKEHSETIQTEEAVKTSVVLPFLQALGYDVFNPAEVVPEFTADTIGKKGEKVDYAINKAGEVSILIECKGLSTQLNEKHLAQLYRYFTVTNARFAMLTNGREYRFFTDLDESHRLDKRPFFVFDLLDYNPGSISELAKFSKSSFDVDNILLQAERLKYVSAIKKVLEDWIDQPSDGLVRLVAAEVHEGRLSQPVKETIGTALSAAFKEIVRDRVRGRLNSALEDPVPEQTPHNEPDHVQPSDTGVVTTQEEIEGWLTIKAILRETVDTDRIFMRDAKSYCAVLLDDNNRKPIARLHFNGAKKKYIGLFDGEAEERVEMESMKDFFALADRVKAAVAKYDE
ncbi:type I restriction endonuclease [Marinibacterium profundimaris]|uniref:Restriction endonuclease or methylase n=1 Tax=Marinibacterium profundimaris TaxID=1679460 RepID=A0A225NL54_9RHOB|nr:type I restriction endonuclease [Marinibacterium profundimaris]OWU70512.1 restriction endonuclease or methylase [Marinibacterium profundimaris]